MSLDCYFNERLIKAIGQNLAKSTQLSELTLIGVHFSANALQVLNDGLLKSVSLRKLRMNYCFSRPELLIKIFPALSSPSKLPLQELNLAANGLTDLECGEILSKILNQHCENRDEIYWKYGLRGELPPHNELSGLKLIDLSFNKLGERACYNLGKTLKTDRYLLALNLRSNQITTEMAEQIVKQLQENRTLFNLDLRDNVNISQKVYRKLALKLLTSYTSTGQTTPADIWEREQKYFNSELLVVQIPQSMVSSYAKKLEAIRTMTLSQVLTNES